MMMKDFWYFAKSLFLLLGFIREKSLIFRKWFSIVVENIDRRDTDV